ncbi:UxaA family hydrolase [Halococcus salsus]|uniref:UxaA family hydrolase n=1 Tax=Halococcus salsus TaxID=2162894 RepID=UPI001962BCB6|nr:UxaA family hydrolase [Halococcus salsus]
MRANVPSTEIEERRRGDERVAVRNRVLVLPSVICSHVVADEIADRVDQAVSAPHDHGCAQIGADNAQTKRTFVSVGRNPNIAGTVVVGLGCEAVQSDEVVAELAEYDIPVRETIIQEAGGTDECIAEGIAQADDLAGESEHGRPTVELGDLTVGVVASDCDRSTRKTVDPLMGRLVDEVTEAGGRVVVAGTERFVPHADEIRGRFADAHAERTFEALLDRHERQSARAPPIRRAASEAGAASATDLLGDQPIADVLQYGERATCDGAVTLVDAPSQVEEAATALAAAGAHLIVHATSEGVPTGHPVVPILKITGDSRTAAVLGSDIDLDASAPDIDLQEAVGGGRERRAHLRRAPRADRVRDYASRALDVALSAPTGSPIAND